MAEVLADVLRRGLRQQAVNTLPETERRPLNYSARSSGVLRKRGVRGEILEMGEERINAGSENNKYRSDR